MSSASRLVRSAIVPALLLALVSTAASSARADGAPSPPAVSDPPTAVAAPPVAAMPVRELPPIPAEPVTRRRWYGWQLMLADFGGVATVFASPWAPVGVFVLGGPAIHIAHGHSNKAVASFLLRLGLPAGGMLIGGVVGNENCKHSEEFLCGLGEVLVGGLIGITGALVIDYGVLAFDRKPVRLTEHARQPGLVPLFAVTPTGVSVGLGARF